MQILVASMLLAAAALPAADGRKIAVTDLEVSAGVSAALGESLSLVMPAEVRARAPKAKVVSAAEIRNMLGFDRQQQLAGCSDGSSECLAELSGALGADELITGKLGRAGATFLLEVRRIDVRRNQTIHSVSRSLAVSEEALVPELRSAIAALFPPVGSEGLRLRTVSWVPLAAGAVSLGASAILFRGAESAHRSLQAPAPPAPGADPEAIAEAGRTQQTYGWVTLAGGVALLGTGAALYLLGGEPPGDATRTAAAVWLTPNGGAVSVGGTWP